MNLGVATYQRIDSSPLAAGSAPSLVFTALTLDGSNTPIDLSGKLVRFIAYSLARAAPCDDPFKETPTPLFVYDTNAGGVTVTGADNNIVTVTFSQTDTATPGQFEYWLLNVTDRLPLSRGKLPIRPAVWSV